MVSRRWQGGFASLIGIAAVLLITCAVALVIQLLLDRMQQLRLEERHIRLTTLSDAGLAQSLATLRTDPTFAGAPPRSYGSGTIASRVVADSPDTRQVEVVATWGGWSVRLQAAVELEPLQTPRVVRWQRRQLGLNRPAGVGSQDRGSATFPR